MRCPWYFVRVHAHKHHGWKTAREEDRMFIGVVPTALEISGNQPYSTDPCDLIPVWTLTSERTSDTDVRYENYVKRKESLSRPSRVG